MEWQDGERLHQQGKIKREKCVQFLVDNGYDLEFVNELIRMSVQPQYVIQNKHVVENDFVALWQTEWMTESTEVDWDCVVD